MKYFFILFFLFYNLEASIAYKYSDPVELSFVYYKKEKAPQKYNSLLFGMKTAANQINKNGGLAGHKILIVDYNEKGDVKETIKIANKIATNKSVVGVVGFSNSQRAKQSISYVINKKIPIISSAGSDTLLDIGKNSTFFTTNFGIKGELLYLEKFISVKNYKKITFITTKGDSYASEYYQGVKKILDSKLLTLDSMEDFSIIDAKKGLIDKDTLVIISTNVQDNAKISKYLRFKNIQNDIFLAKGGIIGEGFYKAGGKGLKNIYELSTLLAGVSNDTLLKFKQSHKKYFNKGTNESYLEYAAYGYDSVNLLKNAYSKAAPFLDTKDIEDIRNIINLGLKSTNITNPFDGIAESYSFNEHRQGGILTPQYILKSTGNKATVYKKQFIFQDGKLTYVPTLYTNIDIKNITMLNQEASLYEVDFMLTLISEQDIKLEDIEFENIRINSAYTPSIYAKEFITRTSKVKNIMHVKTYNIKASFEYGNTIEDFPFDVQSLPIFIKPKNPLQSNFITYFVTDFKSILSNDLTSGWKVTNAYAGFKKGAYTFIDSEFNEVKNYYYRSSMTLDVKRLATSSAIKFILPLMIVVLITIALFFLPDNSAGDKIGASSNMLITVAALYFTYATLVEVDYLTFVDKLYMGALFFVLIANIIFILRQRYYNVMPENLDVDDYCIAKTKDTESLKKHYKKYSWLFYNSTLIISIILFIFMVIYIIKKATF